MSGKRILMVHSERGWRGGEAQIELLIAGLRDRGCDVALAAPSASEIVTRCEAQGVTVYPLKGGVVRSATWLRRLLSAHNPGVVHAHASKAHSMLALATAGMRSGALRVVSRRVSFPCGNDPLSRLKYTHGADLYLAVSSAAAETLTRCGVERDRVRVVPDGIDLEACRRAGASRNETPDRFRVGVVAALTREKGIDDFVTAAVAICGRRHDVVFDIVGDGPQRRELEAAVANAGCVDRIVFSGFREDVLERIAMMDCFVLPSREEGLGTSILLAQAIGVPVVATVAGGIPDIVTDGTTGLLVRPDDPSSLAAAIERALDDKALRDNIVTGARDQVAGYGMEQTVYKTVEAYQSFLTDRSSPLQES